MKMLVWIAVCLLALSGCAAEETFETIADSLEIPAMVQPKQIHVALPGETALPAMEQGSDRLYLGSDYEILVQTLPGGDLADTIRQVSGFEKEELTVVETGENPVKVEFVWVSAGEARERLGRCAILDDGAYHYCLSVLRDADSKTDLQTNWDQVFDSFCLV